MPSIKIGDTFTILYDGITYAYTVSDLVVVDPTDLSVLEQKFDDSYVTLVTCVPPGTYWKRLNVRASQESVRKLKYAPDVNQKAIEAIKKACW